MSDLQRAIDTFTEAAVLNREDAVLQGSLLVFPNYGQVVMTGDLHGHRRNFDKLKRFCDLQRFGPRHVILHELIHEDIMSIGGRDTSHLLLLDAARWKCEFPDQIHFLQSNHELAQLNHHEITKNGRVVTAAFEQSVCEHYADRTGRVMEAILKFIGSYPLAGRTPNRVFLSHSLPGPSDLPSFDTELFARVPTATDLSERGSVHSLVWGRYQTASELDVLRDLLDVDFFLCGHQPQEMGYEVLHERMVILASDHNHGVFLPLDLSKPPTIEMLTRNIKPFAGVE